MPLTPIIDFGIPILVETQVGVGDFIDYIFQFPDQGSFLRDPIIQAAALLTGNSGQSGVQLLVYNPVETLQAPVPTIGNSLVTAPQLANSTVALPGFWAMLTIQSARPLPALTLHPNIQIVNDRTLMFAGKPSVLQASIDVSHINIVINIFGVYVRDGLQPNVIATPFNALTDDAGTVVLTNDTGGQILLAG